VKRKHPSKKSRLVNRELRSLGRFCSSIECCSEIDLETPSNRSVVPTACRATYLLYDGSASSVQWRSSQTLKPLGVGLTNPRRRVNPLLALSLD